MDLKTLLEKLEGKICQSRGVDSTALIYSVVAAFLTIGTCFAVRVIGMTPFCLWWVLANVKDFQKEGCVWVKQCGLIIILLSMVSVLISIFDLVIQIIVN